MSKDPKISKKRSAERGDAKQLVGHIRCWDKYGNPIPMLDKNGDELIAVTPGPKKKGKK